MPNEHKETSSNLIVLLKNLKEILKIQRDKEKEIKLYTTAHKFSICTIFHTRWNERTVIEMKEQLNVIRKSNRNENTLRLNSKPP